MLWIPKPIKQQAQEEFSKKKKNHIPTPWQYLSPWTQASSLILVEHSKYVKRASSNQVLKLMDAYGEYKETNSNL